MDYNSFFNIIQTIFVLIAVIALANILLKSLSKQINKRNTLIKIHERVSVNNNSSLNIVEICGQYYLMSFTSSENKILKELSEEEVIALIHKNQNNCTQVSFKGDELKRVKEKVQNVLRMRKKID